MTLEMIRANVLYLFRMIKMERFQPSASLVSFVKSFMIVESDEGTQSRILPATAIMLALKIKGKVSQKNEEKREALPSMMISGLRDSLRVVDYAQQSSMLLVAFKEGGAQAFFPGPQHELFGMSLPLEDLLRRRSDVVEIEERLSEAQTNEERIEVVEDFLMARMINAPPDPLVLAALGKIKTARGDVQIKDLLKLLHTSRDPFEKRFRSFTGTSPKQYSRIIRLRSLIASYTPEKNLADLAADFGYFDQSHFIKDFRSFTGQSPRQFFNSASYW